MPTGGSPRPRTSSTGAQPPLDRLARQEHTANVARMRRMLYAVVPIWFSCGTLDWVIVQLDLPGQLTRLWGVRSVEGLVCCVALWRITRRAPLSPRAFRVLEQAVFDGAAIALSVMSVIYMGIGSTYGAAIACVLVARGIALPDRWQRGVVLLGLPIAAFVATLGLAATVVPRIAEQFHDPHACAMLFMSLTLQLSTYAILVAGGNAVWRMRIEALEATSVGRYRLRQPVGAGGMGEVWVAHHPSLKRDVAVKILRRSVATEANIARFEREVRATAELAHPNTVRIYDYGATEDGVWFYAMELLQGETLADLADRENGLEPARAVHLVLQAARALAEAHGRGIVHRDVKPANIFLTSQGGERDFVKVLDFGIAKVAEQEVTATCEKLTREGSVIGTPAYMAPEQAAGEAVDPRSDVYALGAVLYFALTGVPPFGKGSAAQTLMSHLRDPVVPPSVRTERTIPRDVEEIVVRCLEKERDRRYASAAELAEALGACSIAGTWRPARASVVRPSLAGAPAPSHDTPTIPSGEA